jgi:DNA-binding transcriptional MocR family regulator
MTELLKTGNMEKHIEDVLNPTYQRRCHIMMGSIKRDLMPLGVRAGEVSADGKEIFGGYFIWLELPRDVSAEAVADRAKIEENLIVAPGHIFEVENDAGIKFPNSLRLCFSWEKEVDLVEGVARLARVVRDVKDGIPPSTNGNKVGKTGVEGDISEFR